MGSNGLLRRFERCMEEGSFYDAEQACLSAYFRAMKMAAPKGSGGAHDDATAARDRAFALLVDAARRMVAAKQIQSATTLALEAVKHVREHQADASQTKLEDLTAVVKSFPQALDPPSNGESGSETALVLANELYANQARALSAMLELSAPTNAACAQELERLSGVAQWRLARYSDAQDHFAKCAPVSAALWGTMVAQWCTVPGAAVRSERGLYLARAALLLAAHPSAKVRGPEAVAGELSALHAAYCAHLGHRSPDVVSLVKVHAAEDRALERMVFLLTLAIRTTNSDLFQLVSSTYRSSLARDPRLERLMDSVARAWFGIHPQASTSGAPGNSLFASLMGDMMRGMMNSQAGP